MAKIENAFAVLKAKQLLREDKIEECLSLLFEVIDGFGKDELEFKPFHDKTDEIKQIEKNLTILKSTLVRAKKAFNSQKIDYNQNSIERNKIIHAIFEELIVWTQLHKQMGSDKAIRVYVREEQLFIAHLSQLADNLEKSTEVSA